MGHENACRAMVCSRLTPAAVAIIALNGGVEDALPRITGRSGWTPGEVRLQRLLGVDSGVVACTGDETALIMPHGGPRVIQRLCRGLVGTEVRVVESVESLYPEAGNMAEQAALSLLARAASPLAVDALLAAVQTPGDPAALGRRFDALIEPRLVVVAGPSNVGKSTLSNSLTGHRMALEADAPGTTRDFVCRRVNLKGLVVDWCDTPGFREAPDPIEASAHQVAATLIQRADVLIALTDHQETWPELTRRPDLRIANKSDLGTRALADLHISARTGENLEVLVERVRQLVLGNANIG